MNQEWFAAAVVEHLERSANADPLAWVPAVGITRSDGTLFGLGIEILGEQPTQAQLDVLARVLFRLAMDGRIEVQSFRPNRRAGKLGSPRGTDQTAYSLVGPGSKALRHGARLEFGVRLTESAPRTAGNAPEL